MLSLTFLVFVNFIEELLLLLGVKGVRRELTLLISFGTSGVAAGSVLAALGVLEDLLIALRGGTGVRGRHQAGGVEARGRVDDVLIRVAAIFVIADLVLIAPMRVDGRPAEGAPGGHASLVREQVAQVRAWRGLRLRVLVAQLAERLRRLLSWKS